MSVKAKTQLLLPVLALAALGVTAPARVSAQVVFSTGVQEVYDDNIFLEDKLDTPLELTPVPQDSDTPPTGPVITKDVDGDPNEDLISSVYLQASGLVPLSQRVKTSVDAKVGALIFSKEDTENRLTLDSNVMFKSERAFIPEPYSLTLRDSLRSGQSSVNVSQGTGARHSETNDAAFEASATKLDVMDRTFLDLTYTFLRHDFLGEFLFKSNADDERVELKGSDYISNRIGTMFRRTLTDRAEATLQNDVEYMAFTSAESNFGEVSNSDLDRINYHPAIGVNYLTSERTALRTQVGLDYSYYADEPEPTTRGIRNEDGTITPIVVQPDRNQNSLFFKGDFFWSPTDGTTFSIGALQSAGTDLDGQRVTTRSFNANAYHLLLERVELILAGQFSQFETGDSLSNASERFDATAALRVSLTDTIALQLGYNYTNQNSDENEVLSQPLGRGGDYESNRAFISLDTGFVGLPS